MVRDILALPSVQASRPEVAAAAQHLDNPVRWVHTFEQGAGASRLLRGFDVVLTSGIGWPDSDRDLMLLVEDLASARVSGVVLELGSRFRRAPQAMTKGLAAKGIPLIVLHREAAFIDITEAAHRQILAQQLDALDARDEVHTVFTTLALQGSPPDFVVAQVSRMLRCPVVLEDLSHTVVSFAQRDLSLQDLLNDWETRSRRAVTSNGLSPQLLRTVVAGPEDWLITPVAARGSRWGRLIAFPGPSHSAGRSLVLEQAAVALSLSRAAYPEDRQWKRLVDRRPVESLLARKWIDVDDLAAQWRAGGIDLDRATFMSCIVSVFGIDHGQVSADDRLLEIALTNIAARGLTARGAVTSSPNHPSVLVLVAVSGHGQPTEPAGRTQPVFDIAEPLRAALPPGYDVRLVAGEASDRIETLVESLTDTLAVATGLGRFGTHSQDMSGTATTASGHRLGPLLRELSGTATLSDFIERTVGPLIDHDVQMNSELVPTLRAYLRSPGNRSTAANELRIARSVLYQRIATIEQLIHAKLDDGETQAALQAALLAHDANKQSPQHD
ncbi:PucR family transcriptional regulator ligand-binding domain-containing protein [Gordonia jinhuaensis]|uniref:Purine catabolism regulatory protein n=1 Tax=Gordonia jinhuaensis TaxID=1517702 RepID=A0A916TC78_9ACTN|nr:PucR family transcriptional regulator [Gordonia jinhuaensis]GGB38449.1 hypothetical protein GCM10011489_27660 [Gordonia jinhuaensis]